MPDFTPCKDFELAPPEVVPRDSLLKGDPKVSGFVIALATAFNDLKGLLWFVEQLSYGKDPMPKVDAYNGQWSGMSWQAKRMLISVFYEVLKAISQNRGLVDHPDFQKAVANSGTSAKVYWKRLIAINDGRGDAKSRAAKLVWLARKVRNEVAYHYYEPKHFIKGYKLWLGTYTGPAAEHAYVSLGKNMLETRFYFADAVCEAHLQKSFTQHGVTENELFAEVKAINNSLRFIVEEYIRLFATPKPAPGSSG